MTKLYEVVATSMILFIISLILINGIVFLELFSTTSKYQLHNDLKAGDVQAMELYQKTYVEKGIILFDDIN